MSLTLVMDRSSDRPCAALYDGARSVAERVWDGNPSMAPAWMNELSQMLAEAGAAAGDIGIYLCGIGPGSFSGIRACLAAFQGLALPHGGALRGVASAAAVALAAAPAEGGVVSVVGDARRERLWVATYSVREGALTLADGSAPRHTSEDFVLVEAGALAEAIPAGAVVVSPDYERLAERLNALEGRCAVVKERRFPKTVDLIRLEGGARRDPLPIYLHPAVK